MPINAQEMNLSKRPNTRLSDGGKSRESRIGADSRPDTGNPGILHGGAVWIEPLFYLSS
ncbi:hypothetical protein Y023_4842 [Burkholderia pseudomallei A79D]|nr:hypothetical protein DO70_5075 [Burkholderia pseudomallei]KGX97147.1 hypothetical protein Y023_4842 [Burkholderia pseudomallei A79D]KGX98002.1 hypothetical protein X997_4557 [Burkholderia pseudomallei A79C]